MFLKMTGRCISISLRLLMQSHALKLADNAKACLLRGTYISSRVVHQAQTHHDINDG